MSAMKYLWIGVGNSAEGRSEIVKNGGKVLSAEVSNDALLAGLDACGIMCDTINAPSLPDYPLYKKKRTDSYRWSRTGSSEDSNVGHLNYKYINRITKRIAMIREARRWAKKWKDQPVTVFVYSMQTPFLAAAKEIKRINPRTQIVLLILDLPQYMDLAMSKLKALLKRIDWGSIRRLLKSADKFLPYSRHMADFLKLPDGSWTVMEGAFDPSLLVEETVQQDPQIISVMYSGVLDLRYGIPELLDAMEQLPENYELWLTGAGNAVHMIEERAAKDSRIKFYGYLPSRKDLLLKQKQATMLISTRDPEEEASAYCFPSKIFEYMISGNPVISTRIKGIPDEYFEYLIALKTITSDEIANTIRQISDMPVEQRKAIGERGKKFVLDEKSNSAQAKKMLDFVTKAEN